MKEQETMLVMQAQDGDSDCFEQLYERYHKKVFAIIRATVKNSADAEDLLQQTFLSVWQNLKKLNNPAAFNTWIQRIAINHCNELLRKKNIAILLDAEETLDSLRIQVPMSYFLPCTLSVRIYAFDLDESWTI